MDPSLYPSLGAMPPDADYLSVQRPPKGPYKERFHVTRERYALATQMQEEYRRELEACVAKERVLQEEVNLLIDVLGVTLVDSPTIREFMSVTPPPPAPRPLPHGTSRYPPGPKKEERNVSVVPKTEPLPHGAHGKEQQPQPMQEDDLMEG